jgi:hypothetical protein
VYQIFIQKYVTNTFHVLFTVLYKCLEHPEEDNFPEKARWCIEYPLRLKIDPVRFISFRKNNKFGITKEVPLSLSNPHPSELKIQI